MVCLFVFCVDRYVCSVLWYLLWLVLCVCFDMLDLLCLIWLVCACLFSVPLNGFVALCVLFKLLLLLFCCCVDVCWCLLIAFACLCCGYLGWCLLGSRFCAMRGVVVVLVLVICGCCVVLVC